MKSSKKKNNLLYKVGDVLVKYKPDYTPHFRNTDEIRILEVLEFYQRSKDTKYIVKILQGTNKWLVGKKVSIIESIINFELKLENHDAYEIF